MACTGMALTIHFQAWSWEKRQRISHAATRFRREEQDQYALRSQQRAQTAFESGRFTDEVVPLEIKGRKGEAISFARDEHARADAKLEDFAKLPPVFSREGTVTAGNSSGITDGAAALVVLGEEALRRTGSEPEARLVDYEIAGVAPEIMGIGPVPAVSSSAGKAENDA